MTAKNLNPIYEFYIPYLSLNDIKYGLNQLKRNYYVKPAARFVHQLRKPGNNPARVVYKTVNGAVIPAIDGAASVQVVNTAKNFIPGLEGLPALPIPGYNTVKGIQHAFTDSPNVQAEKARQFFKHPVKSVAKKGAELVYQPWVDIVQTPVMAVSRLPGKIKSATETLHRAVNPLKMNYDEFVKLPKATRDKLYADWQKANMANASEMLNKGSFKYEPA